MKYSILGLVLLVAIWTVFLFGVNSLAYSNEYLLMPNGKTFKFLNADEGYNFYLNNKLLDNFSGLDIQLRLEKEMQGKDLEACKNEYQEFLKDQILNWKDIDKRFITKRLVKAYEMIEQTWPDVLQDTIYMILTTGKQEFGGFHTMGNAIVCPQGKMRISSVYLPFLGYLKRYFTRVMVHELFHVYSTNNPEKRSKLYEIIGFEPINNLVLDSEVLSKLIYNPDDKPGFYKIRLTDKNSKTEKDYCMLILSKYPAWQGYIEFKGRISTLLVYVESYLHQIERKGGEWVSVYDETGKPVIKQKSDFIDFYDKTGYDSYSPEEIVAHLFIDLVLSEFDEDIIKNKPEHYRQLLIKLHSEINAHS
jgi:hypothetical protein